MNYLDAIDFSSLDPAISSRCQAIVDRTLAYFRRAGYQITVCDRLAELKEFWETNNRAEGLIRLTAFDNNFQRDGCSRGLFLETLDGERVGTIWHKRFALRDPRTLKSISLKEAFEGLYIFYHDPGDAPRREVCKVESDFAEDIRRGTISYRGAYFILPEHQGQKLAKPLSTLSRMLSITSEESFDWMVLISCDKDQDRMLDLFPCTSFTRSVTHKGIRYWLCTATYADTVRLTLDAAE